MSDVVTIDRCRDSDLTKAISLRCAMCYGAMSFANAIGGSRTPAWDLCHSTPLINMIEESRRRNLDLSSVKTAVDDIAVTESLYYLQAVGDISDERYRRVFKLWKYGSWNPGQPIPE